MSLLAESGDYYWQSDTLPLIFVKERHKNGDNNDNNGDKQAIRNFIKKSDSCLLIEKKIPKQTVMIYI